ncbi:hypothetical protein FACS1894219_08240 [Clostridia bacterium]|nr:hypothetical protein FACS1894219_08240 [Clostridia bacterium]
MPNTCVTVRRQPDNYMTAKYLLSSFQEPHWDWISGGVRTTMFDQPFIYGYVMCTEAEEGEVAHSGTHGSCPHRIKVCALKKDNKDIYTRLLELAGPRPDTSWLRSKPTTGNTCKKDIILALTDKIGMRGTTLIDELLEIGHGENNIRAVLKKLDKQGVIVGIRDPDDKRYNYYKLPRRQIDS